VGVAGHTRGAHLGEASERVVASGQRADERGPGDHVLPRHFVKHPEREREATGLGVSVGQRGGDVDGGDGRRNGGCVKGRGVRCRGSACLEREADDERVGGSQR
jgi:hypothetical protein